MRRIFWIGYAATVILNLSYTECVITPMSAIMETLLQQVRPNAISMSIKNFYERNKNYTNLIYVDLWYTDMIKHVQIKLLLFSKHKENFFNVSCESKKMNACVDTGKE